MDAAQVVAKGRGVLSLLLVEGEADDPMTVPEKWTRGITLTFNPICWHRVCRTAQIKSAPSGVLE